MRIRQIKPAFWTDVQVAELPAAVRLTFIGLWMIADDGGWLRYDAPQVANELYGYESRRRRERAVSDHVAQLVTAGRVVVYPCGHAFVPHLTEHQRLAGGTHQVLTMQREHAACVTDPAHPRGSPRTPDTVRNGSGKERIGKERNGTPPARAREGAREAGPTSEFTSKVPRRVALGEDA